MDQELAAVFGHTINDLRRRADAAMPWSAIERMSRRGIPQVEVGIARRNCARGGEPVRPFPLHAIRRSIESSPLVAVAGKSHLNDFCLQQ
jgi:hypothetical protein